MSQHYRLFSDTKQQYARIFAQARLWLEGQLAELRHAYACEVCDSANAGLESWFETLHPGCGYRPWQEAALAFIDRQVGGEIVGKLNQIEAYKNTFNCHMCGLCCRLASADASYDELRQRADAGDDFSRQFTSVFLPYASREAARRQFPQAVEAVLAEAGEDASDAETIHFYHCPYIGEDNRCTVYGTDKRPGICAAYPETPLSFMHDECAWKPWKDETHDDTLAAHAMLALCTDWADKLRAALN